MKHIFLKKITPTLFLTFLLCAHGTGFATTSSFAYAKVAMDVVTAVAMSLTEIAVKLFDQNKDCPYLLDIQHYQDTLQDPASTQSESTTITYSSRTNINKVLINTNLKALAIITAPQMTLQSPLSCLPIPTITPETTKIANTILRRLGITHPSPVVQQLIYLIAPIFYDPLAVNTTLSGLSQDHVASIMREAYHAFYDGHGIYRLSKYDPKRLEGITLPECINNESYSQTRVTLNTLLRITAGTPEAKQQVKTALKYIEQACLEKSLRDEYTAIATAMCNAMVIKEWDKAILFLDNFTELNKTAEQRTIRSSLMRDAVMLYEKINQPNISKEEREDYRKKLYIVETICKRLLTLHKDKQVALNRFYNEKIKPTLETIGAYNLGIICAQFIYNELATPAIPAVGTAKNDGTQQDEQENGETKNIDDAPESSLVAENYNSR